jgi:hypothetical protein
MDVIAQATPMLQLQPMGLLFRRVVRPFMHGVESEFQTSRLSGHFVRLSVLLAAGCFSRWRRRVRGVQVKVRRTNLRRDSLVFLEVPDELPNLST